MILFAKVKIHGGDYDCSESVRMCYAAAGVLHWNYWDSYMWTGNEAEVLLSHGFAEIAVLSAGKMKRGDVLLKSGHTELYLGDGVQAGARGDELGGIGYGATVGDQTGYELAKSSYRQSQWARAFRYMGAHEINGIPAPEIAAQVMEHLVSHDSAHGYSQPARAGDGSVETIEIKYETGLEGEMTPCIITIENRNTQVYCDFHDIHDLSNPQARDALQKAYRLANGNAMPSVKLTEEEFARLCQALRSNYPKHLRDLVLKYASRSPIG